MPGRVLSFFAIAVSFGIGSAQDPKIPVPPEVSQLEKRYEDAVKKALQPIRLTYRDELIKLRQKFLLENSKEKVYAVDIKLRELDPSYILKPLPGMEENLPLSEYLRNTQWSWHANDSLSGPAQWIHFGEKGVITASWGGRRQYDFEVSGKDVVAFDGHVLAFDRKKKQFAGHHLRPNNKRSGKLMSRRSVESIPD